MSARELEALKASATTPLQAFRPVHVALGEAPARLAEHGVTDRTYFNAGKGLLIA